MARVPKENFRIRLQKLDLEYNKSKQSLLERREQELLKIITKCDYPLIEDEVLAGAILFIKESMNNKKGIATSNNVHNIIEEFKNRGIRFLHKSSKLKSANKVSNENKDLEEEKELLEV